MATLEKIRSKSVFLLVVIFFALLAFILGDAITNGRNLFGDHTRVAKVGGEKIDYMDYQRKREELNQQLEQARQQNPQQVANFDVQLLPQMALNQLVSENSWIAPSISWVSPHRRQCFAAIFWKARRPHRSRCRSYAHCRA